MYYIIALQFPSFLSFTLFFPLSCFRSIFFLFVLGQYLFVSACIILFCSKKKKKNDIALASWLYSTALYRGQVGCEGQGNSAGILEGTSQGTFQGIPHAKLSWELPRGPPNVLYINTVTYCNQIWQSYWQYIMTLQYTSMNIITRCH